MKARYRLKDKACFDQVFKKTKFRAKNTAFIMLVTPHDHKCNKLGFIFPKKHIKKAVIRNRLKRQCRQLFLDKLPPDLGLDIVILSRPQIKNCFTQQNQPIKATEIRSETYSSLEYLWENLLKKPWVTQVVAQKKTYEQKRKGF